MTRLACTLALLLIASASVHAQTTDPRFPVSGTVIKASPVMPSKDDSERRLAVVPGGTEVVVVGRQGFWYRVLVATPEGERAGLMEPTDIRINPDAGLPWDPAGTSAFAARGFVETRGVGFNQASPTDPRRAMGDALVRQEAFVRPARWFQFALGVDLRESSFGQVEEDWRIDFTDRSVLRPRISVRRAAASFTSRHVSLDLGKQFMRWGRADVLSPVDRFAPRDYVNVIDNEFLPVIGARLSVRGAGETFEAIWQPQMTPSRLPIVGQRWTIVPPEAEGLALEDHGSVFPDRAQWGARWSHVGRFEMGLSYFDGFNHLPDINASIDPVGGAVALTRTYAALRSYGAELAVPTPAFVIKTESAYFTSPTATSDEYVLYVVEVERQIGEWLLTGGYAGEIETVSREARSFAAERGLARAFIGRAAYTIDPRRSFEVEGAARQDGRGVYARGEFSQAFGRHWRLTLAAVGIAGHAEDFIGQYQGNSHISTTLRLSY